MSIDVFFTGLMLICLDGQPNCPAAKYDNAKNTAWVVKADGESNPCGRYSPEKTKLELTFSTEEFTLRERAPKVECEPETGLRHCVLPETAICLLPGPRRLAGNKLLDADLQGLLQLGEVDRRFKALRADRLTDPRYVPASIHFPYGNVGVGEKWPSDKNPILWFRSDGSSGGSLPRELSDRLKVTYEIMTLVLIDCETKYRLLVLDRIKKADKAEVVFRNLTADLVAYRVGQYDDLDYLLWYYRLGLWDTTFGSCPDYTPDQKDAVLLRCVRESKDGCASRSTENDTKYWPPIKP